MSVMSTIISTHTVLWRQSYQQLLQLHVVFWRQVYQQSPQLHAVLWRQSYQQSLQLHAVLRQGTLSTRILDCRDGTIKKQTKLTTISVRLCACACACARACVWVCACVHMCLYVGVTEKNVYIYKAYQHQKQVLAGLPVTWKHFFPLLFSV